MAVHTIIEDPSERRGMFVAIAAAASSAPTMLARRGRR
jgi:hypothetical protein